MGVFIATGNQIYWMSQNFKLQFWCDSYKCMCELFYFKNQLFAKCINNAYYILTKTCWKTSTRELFELKNTHCLPDLRFDIYGGAMILKYVKNVFEKNIEIHSHWDAISHSVKLGQYLYLNIFKFSTLKMNLSTDKITIIKPPGILFMLKNKIFTVDYDGTICNFVCRTELRDIDACS